MIKTDNLEIVPLDISFTEDIFQLWKDYDVIKYTYNTLMNTPDDCRIRLLEWLPMHCDKKGPNKLAILLKGKMIGIIGYPIIDNEDFKCGFFYQIVKSHWGNGYAFEAAKAVLSHIYSLHENATIFADAVPANSASIKILTKLGFLKIAIQTNGFNHNGMVLDVYHFEMDKVTFDNNLQMKGLSDGENIL